MAFEDFGLLIVILLLILYSAVKIVQEYERGVIFRLGRLVGARGPGLFFIIPIIEKMVRVDLRTVTLDVPAQEVITRDNVPVRVNVLHWPDRTGPENLPCWHWWYACLIRIADSCRLWLGYFLRYRLLDYILS